MAAKDDQGASPSGPSGGWLKSRRGAGAIWLTLGGQWVAETAGRLDRELHGLDVAGLNHADLDLSAVKRLDATGAWLIRRTQPNKAQRRLAGELTRLVHGEDGLEAALRVTEGVGPGS